MDDRTMSDEVLHLVGVDVQVGSVRRQRCAWCGALLVEDDFSRMAWSLNEDGSDPGPPGPWPVFAVVAVTGAREVAPGQVLGFRGMRVVPRDDWPDAEDEPGEKRLPDGSCALIDLDVTR